jgi:hypothetical protein
MQVISLRCIVRLVCRPRRAGHAESPRSDTHPVDTGTTVPYRYLYEWVDNEIQLVNKIVAFSQITDLANAQGLRHIFDAHADARAACRARSSTRLLRLDGHARLM